MIRFHIGTNQSYLASWPADGNNPTRQSSAASVWTLGSGSPRIANLQKRSDRNQRWMIWYVPAVNWRNTCSNDSPARCLGKWWQYHYPESIPNLRPEWRSADDPDGSWDYAKRSKFEPDRIPALRLPVRKRIPANWEQLLRKPGCGICWLP